MLQLNFKLPGSGSAWIRNGLAPWIRIRIEIKSWIRIETSTLEETSNHLASALPVSNKLLVFLPEMLCKHFVSAFLKLIIVDLNGADIIRKL